MKTSKTFSSNKRNILSLQDLSAVEITRLLRLAMKLKRDLRADRKTNFLQGKTLGMVFQKPSTRTRLSFEVGMQQLGGHAVYLNATDIQLSRGETIEDTARTLSLYTDCIMARVYSHADIEALARYSSVPVINGLSDAYHPCQILADLMTIQEQKGKLRGLRLAWLGDGDNVCNDLVIGCAKTGIHVSVACPRGYEPLKEAVDAALA
ncbi:MAG TPA: ornithine carbamoyltransferase, partial [Nitrososphaera sp.]|nr:ornithine carbamoyltransferase [Nitrososphaera sp.]